jgi:hypothetical protein
MGGEDVQSLQPEEVKQKIAAGDTFVLNVVTDWCPDCSMRQHPNLPAFAGRLARGRCASISAHSPAASADFSLR